MASVKKFKFKRIWSVIIIAVLVLLVSFAATKIVYDQTFKRYDCEVTSHHPMLEETVNAREEKTYSSGENKLRGYLYRSNAAQKKDALIIMAPGFNSCADGYLWQIQELLELGWSVLAFDPTGCCGSEGASCKGFPQEVLDLKETINYVEKQDRFGYNELVLLGHSRGGYAVCCALEYDYEIAAAVSISGINSAMEGVIGSAATYVGPVAYGNYGFLWLYQAMLFGSETVNLRADKAISGSDVPILLIHGADDTTVPCDKYSVVSHRAEITNENAEYLIRYAPDNAEHTDLMFDDDGTANDDLIKIISDFLEKKIEKQRD